MCISVVIQIFISATNNREIEFAQLLCNLRLVWVFHRSVKICHAIHSVPCAPLPIDVTRRRGEKWNRPREAEGRKMSPLHHAAPIVRDPRVRLYISPRMVMAVKTSLLLGKGILRLVFRLEVMTLRW